MNKNKKFLFWLLLEELCKLLSVDDNDDELMLIYIFRKKILLHVFSLERRKKKFQAKNQKEFNCMQFHDISVETSFGFFWCVIFKDVRKSILLF